MHGTLPAAPRRVRSPTGARREGRSPTQLGARRSRRGRALQDGVRRTEEETMEKRRYRTVSSIV